MEIDLKNKSYETSLPESEDEEGFKHKGVLLLKDIINKMEYHLYDDSIPESNDINETLEDYYNNGYKIHLYIKSNTNKNKKPFNQTGKLHKETSYGVVKYFINGEDIENYLWKHTEENVYIKN
jgi:hypothetical protein